MQLFCQNGFRVDSTHLFIYLGIQNVLIYQKSRVKKNNDSTTDQKYYIFHMGQKAVAKHRNNNNSHLLTFQSLMYQNIIENIISFNLTICYSSSDSRHSISPMAHFIANLFPNASCYCTGIERNYTDFQTL